jgi:hypothetical protein
MVNQFGLHTYIFTPAAEYADYSKYLLRIVETFQAYLLLCCVIQE